MLFSAVRWALLWIGVLTLSAPASAQQADSSAPTPEDAEGPSTTERSSARTPRGVVRLGTPTVQGALDAEVIARVVRRQGARLRTCYARTLRERPSLEGSLVLRIIIRSEGGAGAVVVPTSEPGLEEVGLCMARLAPRWRFPRSNAAGVIVVRYPIRLSLS